MHICRRPRICLDSPLLPHVAGGLPQLTGLELFGASVLLPFSFPRKRWFGLVVCCFRGGVPISPIQTTNQELPHPLSYWVWPFWEVSKHQPEVSSIFIRLVNHLGLNINPRCQMASHLRFRIRNLPCLTRQRVELLPCFPSAKRVPLWCFP